MSNIFEQYKLAIQAVEEEEINFDNASLEYVGIASKRLRLSRYYLDEMCALMKMEDKCTVKKYPTEHNLFRRMFGLPR